MSATKNTIRAAVIGTGAWGTTLAKVLGENGHDVLMWAHDPAIAKTINEQHENTALFPGVTLPATVQATDDLARAVTDRELVVLVVASQFFRVTLEQMLPRLRPDCVLISATKGLDRETRHHPSQILEETLPEQLLDRFGILSGPNIAREIAARKAATTVIASHNLYTARRAQAYFASPYFRVYTNTDVVGTELGGTLKNIVAIAAGILDGLELGDNAKSALMVRAMVEIIRFGVSYGARMETFYGLAGMGDLITTCSSPMSRNHTVGTKLAEGKNLEQILGEMTAVAEGVETCRMIHARALELGIDMPVTAQVHAVLFENKPVRQALTDLMTRDLKSEY